MTDTEMTRLCAGAVGAMPDAGNEYFWLDGKVFDPLRNDAQAYALVRRFKLNIGQLSDGRFCKVFMMTPYYEGENTDLNRAIVECVAKMQAPYVAAG